MEALSVSLLLAALLLGWRYSGQPISHPYMAVDSAVYLSGAASLASGNGYSYAPLGSEHPIGFYPPGHSAFLALFWATSAAAMPYDYSWLWCGQTLLSALLFAVTYLWFRSLGVPRVMSGLLIANIAWSPVFAWIHVHLFSDAGFTLFVIAALISWRRFGVGTPWRQLTVGCCIGLSILWRAPGVALLGACAVSLLATKATRSLGAAFLLLTPGAAALIGPKLYGGSGDTYAEALGRLYRTVLAAGRVGSLYLDDLRIWVGGSPLVESSFPLLNRIPPLAARIHPALAPVGAIASSLLIWMLVGVTVFGVRRLPRHQQAVLFIGALAYTSLVLLIPMPPLMESFSRYMLPVATVFLPFAYLGVLRLHPALDRSKAFSVVLAFLLGSLAVQGLIATRGVVSAVNRIESVEDFRLLALMCRDRLPPGTRIAVRLEMPIVDFWRLSGRELVVDPRAHSGGAYFGPSHAGTGSRTFEHRLMSGPPWPSEEPLLRSPLDRWRIYPVTP